MITHGLLFRDRYQDSVRLMRITEALRTMPGISSAGVIAATPANIELLEETGLTFDGLAGASPNDIVMVVTAADVAAADGALDEGRRLLDAAGTEAGRTTYASVEAALEDAPPNAVGLVAVPGAYAAVEARKVLDSGRSVVVFSDNVPLDDELALKAEAHRRGLLVMGPDAGTVMLGGLGLGFCNVVPAGRVGIVAASGTGAQEVASLLARAGQGVTSIVGVGSNDPGDEIGGLSLLDALDSMDADRTTEVVILIAKSFGVRTQARLIARLARMTKPVVTLSPGWSGGWITSAAGAVPAYTFAGAVDAARQLLADPTPRPMVVRSGSVTSGEGRIIRGLFAGGTLAQEARASLDALASVAGPKAPAIQVVDLGADEYTRGRPHPMIAPSIVAEAIVQAAEDPRVSAIVFDVVLGHGSHGDPAGALVPAVEAATRGDRPGGAPQCVAVVCGTDDDPQDRSSTCARLVRAGATVVDDPLSAAAVLLLHPTIGVDEVPSGWVAQLPDAVVTIGTDWFVDGLEAQGASVLHVEWHPPGGGDDELNELLARLM